MISWFEKNNHLSWTITLFGAALIYYLSSITFKSGPSAGGMVPLSFLYHFLAFFFLGAFLMISIVQGKRRELFIWAVVIALLYAVLDEVHQLFVPGRFFSVTDILTDAFGIFYALLIYLLVLEFRRA